MIGINNYDIKENMIKLQQIRSFIAVYENGSFSRGAKHVNATQSGLSMQIQNLELALGARLFERMPKGVAPTAAGRRFYRRSVAIIRDMQMAKDEVKEIGNRVSGRIRVGIIPAFAQSILAPTLVDFYKLYPDVDVAIFEGFSPVLSEAVIRQELDFAVVPADQQRLGLRQRHVATDREILVSNINSDLEHLHPVSPANLPPLKLALPTRGNARRDRLDAFFSLAGVNVEAILEIDSVVATLELVANSDWMTILPSVICSRDIALRVRKLHPIISPRIPIEFVLLEPQTVVPPRASELFLDMLSIHLQKTENKWIKAFPNF